MKLLRSVEAGSRKSDDILIRLQPAEAGISLHLESSVEKQFGEAIRGVIMETLESFGVHAANLEAYDGGALDYVIRARTEAAIYRACKEGAE